MKIPLRKGRAEDSRQTRRLEGMEGKKFVKRKQGIS